MGELAKASAQWIGLHALLVAPMFTNNLELRTALMAFIIPNALRFSLKLNNLKVDRIFMLAATAIAFFITYFSARYSKKVRDGIENYGKKTKRATIETSLIFIGALIAGFLIAYYTVDKSIYSNLPIRTNSLL